MYVTWLTALALLRHYAGRPPGREAPGSPPFRGTRLLCLAMSCVQYTVDQARTRRDSLELDDEAAEGGPVRDALAALVAGAVAGGGRRRGRRREALHDAALVAAAAAGARARVLGLVPRVLERRPLLLLLATVAAAAAAAPAVLLPWAVSTGRTHNLQRKENKDAIVGVYEHASRQN